jgi:hypothetical protein
MNLNAIVIIIASSWTGTLNLFNGENNLSRASVRLTGEVVYVKMDEPTINITTLTKLKIHSFKLLSVIFKNHHDHKVLSPSIMNRLSTAVKMIIGIRGFKLFHMSLMGILVMSHTTHANSVPTANPWNVSVENNMAM